MNVCSNNRGIENIEASHTHSHTSSDSSGSSMGNGGFESIGFFYVKNSGHLGHHVDSPDPWLQDGIFAVEPSKIHPGQMNSG